MGLPIVCDRLALRVDNDSRIVVLGVGWPFDSRVYPFGVASNDGAVVLESCGPRPKGADAGTRGFQKRVDVLERLVIVPFGSQRQPLDSGCVSRQNSPEKASSGRTRRSRWSGSARFRTASALLRLLLTSPTTGANWRHPILILRPIYSPSARRH